MAKNGETKILRKIVFLIIILTAIISPWIVHDRKLAHIDGQLAIINQRLTRIENILNKKTYGLDSRHLGIDWQSAYRRLSKDWLSSECPL